MAHGWDSIPHRPRDLRPSLPRPCLTDYAGLRSVTVEFRDDHGITHGDPRRSHHLDIDLVQYQSVRYVLPKPEAELVGPGQKSNRV